MKKWLHIVLIKRIFGGQADSILSKIRTVFTDDISKEKMKSTIREFPFSTIVAELKGTTKDITFDDEYINNLLLVQKDDALAFSILSILYPNLDYRNGDFHKDHIFAETLFTRKKLKSYGIPDEDINFYLNTENYNSISNLQFLDSNENKSKNASELKPWILKESKNKGVSVKEFCDKHIIPEIFEINEFPKFLKARKKTLKEKLQHLV